MSADTTATAAGSERFVKIPKAEKGQEYKSPKNFPNPFMSGLYQFAVVLMALALPLAPGAIFFMILVYSKAIAMGFLWIWIPMIILTETIAIGIAWGLAREALGLSGVSYSVRRRE
ncbi:MAG TPA: hypothetical protein VF808_11215 [Ktedonobacterales bacterium]